jgi:hypothetical protein
LTVDPDVAETGQPYAYTGDDPLNATDPLGLAAAPNYKPRAACGQSRNLNSKACKTYRKNNPLGSLAKVVKKHWRGIAKVAIVAAGVVGGVACGATVVCGVAVGAFSAAAYYSAGHAGTSSFSYTGLVENTALGGVFGAGGSAASGFLSSGAADINSVIDAGFMSAVSQPISTAGTLAGGYGKLIIGGAGSLLFNTGAAASYVTDR